MGGCVEPKLDCCSIEYFVDGARVVALAGELGSQLPTCTRSGTITIYDWGNANVRFVCDEEPGYLLKWPQDPWVPLDVIKRGDWWQFKPQPVRIAASRFLVYRNN